MPTGRAGVPASTDGPATAESHPSRMWPVPAWLARAAGWIWRLLLLAAALYVLLWTLGRLRVVLVPVLVALLLAALASPVSEWIARRGVPRIVGAWIVLVTFVALVGAVVWMTVVGVGNQLGDDEQWADVRSEVRTWLSDGPLGLDRDEIDDLEDRVVGSVRDGFTTLDTGRVRLVVEMTTGALLAVVLFFFFVKDGPSMWGWVVGRFRDDRRGVVDRAGRKAFSALAAYMRGVAFTGIVDALAIGLALWIIGVPLVVPLAILTFFGAFFPIVGATVVGALATLVALVVNGPTDALLVAGVTLAVQQIEGDVIMPLVMRRQVSLHPAVVLVALAAGGALAGIMGAFVAVPITAMAVAGGRALREPPSDDP
ncbi:MAG: AI-2E family transporter [Acidimicrobiales bacterium]|nr:AI-2E family transporter [Acidimicrobiales bacterium]